MVAISAPAFVHRPRIPFKPVKCSILAAAIAVSFSANAQEDETIVITGTRIQQSGMQTPTPVTVVLGEELDASAPDMVINGLTALPQFYGSETPAGATGPTSWFTRGGYGNLNLRGLGINRTLTLLNGRRMVSSTPFGGVDVNTFPEALIGRIDTVTGGASAAYGTDAVAGVVNFVLNTEYPGITALAQTGATSNGDGDSSELSVTFGTDIGERGHMLVSAEQFQQDEIRNYEGRDWYQGWGTVPDATGMRLIRPYVVSRNATFDGLIIAPGSSLNGLAFDRNGDVAPFVTSDTSFGALGVPPARQSVVNGGSGDNFGAEVAPLSLSPKVERESLFGYFDFDVSDKLNFFAQFISGSNDTARFNNVRGSLQGTPTSVTIFQGNAFLPDAINQTMINEGLASFTFKRRGSLEDIGDLRLWDENESDSLTAGFRLDLESDGRFDGWTIDAYAQLAENERRGYQKGLRVDRIHAAVDAVRDANGNIVCRAALPIYSGLFADCEPLNLFGRGNASPEAIDWVIGNDVGEVISTPLYVAGSGFALGLTDTYVAQEAKVNIVETDGELFELTASGEIAEGWGAGPISLAAGFAYRHDDLAQTVRDSTNRSSNHDSGHPVLCNTDPEAIAAGLRGVSGPDCANTVGIQYSKVSNVRGDQSVREVFVESYVPVVADRMLMESFTIGLASRWADYSGSGNVTAWKAGLDMQIIDQFRFRATRSRDVRAGNLSERFDKTGGIDTLTDPRYPAIPAYNVTRFSGGNPNVAPEEADTLTAGFVYQPPAVDGLSLSFDWYDIEIDGAIGQLGTQNIVNRCQESGGTAPVCSLVTRDAVTDLLILVGDVYINIDKARVTGRDLEAVYTRNVSWFGDNAQSIQMRAFMSWLGENSETLGGTQKIDRAGQTGREQIRSDGDPYALPDFKMTANLMYSNGPFKVFVQGRYIGSGVSETGLIEGVHIESNRVDSVFYTDLRFGYEHELSRGTTLEFFANVTNLFDQDPPITPFFSPFVGYPDQANPALFDMLGRRYAVGLRARF